MRRDAVSSISALPQRRRGEDGGGAIGCLHVHQTPPNATPSANDSVQPVEIFPLSPIPIINRTGRLIYRQKQIFSRYELYLLIIPKAAYK